jgi:hypothetical protein
MKAGGRLGRRFDLLKYVDASHEDGDLDAWVDGNIELDLDRLFPESGGEARNAPARPRAKR